MPRYKKSDQLSIRLPIEVKRALETYVSIYDREICKPQGKYTDISKTLRALIVCFLMKKHLIGYEFEEYTDPCHSERVVE